MGFGVGAYIHYKWSLLLLASPGREDQAGDRGGTERRERRQGKDRGWRNKDKVMSMCDGVGLNDDSCQYSAYFSIFASSIT